MEIALVNESTMVSNADVATIAQAINTQIALHAAPAWNQKPVPVKFYADASKVPNWSWCLHLINDDSSVPGALGWHLEETSGRVDGYVLCAPILQNGGSILTFDPKNPRQYTVSGTISHEALEIFGDKFANGFSLGTQIEQGNLYAQELCDPVESLSYGLNVGSQEVSLSNFVFPSWFNMYANASNMPFDYLKVLKKSFSMDEGGYMIVASIDNEGQVQASRIYDPAMPQWRRDTKEAKLARGGRRGSK